MKAPKSSTPNCIMDLHVFLFTAFVRNHISGLERLINFNCSRYWFPHQFRTGLLHTFMVLENSYIQQSCTQQGLKKM